MQHTNPNTVRFTADQAYEASQTGEPITIGRPVAMRLVAQHHCDWAEFESDLAAANAQEFDAWQVLSWLGY